MQVGRAVMKTRILSLLLALCLAPLFAARGEEPEVFSRMIDVPGSGPVQYYAQNDPAWKKAIYEEYYTSRRRRMLDTGCGPATLAMAVARQVPSEDLPALNAFAKDPAVGFPLCSCSVTGEYCFEDYYIKKRGYGQPGHVALTPGTPQEYSKWLPMILASYAVGNNHRYEKLRTFEPGTKIYLFRMVAEDYGLAYTSTHEFEEALAAVRAGKSVITTVVKGIFTTESHYLFLAGADSEYLYIMDSYAKTAYPRDKEGYLEVIEPGLLRVKLEDVPAIQLYSFYIMHRETDRKTEGGKGA